MSFRIGDKVTVHTKGYDPKEVFVVVDILHYPENERYAYDFADLELDNGDFVSEELCHRAKEKKSKFLNSIEFLKSNSHKSLNDLCPSLIKSLELKNRRIK